MAERGVLLQNMESKANLADKMIMCLQEQLKELKRNTAAEACRQEEATLTTENAALRRELEELKRKLVAAEVRNGVPQVPLPSRSNVIQPSAAQPMVVRQTETQQDATPAKAPASEDAPPNKQQKKKEKKEGKPKAAPGPPAAELPVDVSRLDMRVGFIVSARKHPDADGLYVEDVDLGEGRTRTIVSGLVKFVPLEQMQQRHAIFMCNLKPAKMRGILSEGMIMCASTPEKVEIIDLPEGVGKGDRVTVPGYPGTPDTMLNPKKKIWEQVQPDLRISAEGVATYRGAPWTIGDKGICKAPTMKDSPIK